MAFQIRVVPDSLRGSSATLKTISSEMAELSSEMSSMKGKLDSAWDGGASYQALDNIDEIVPVLSRISDYLAESSSVLLNVVNAFESVDGNEGGLSIAPIAITEAFSHMLKCPMPKPWPILGALQHIRIIPDEVREVAHQCRMIAERCLEKMGALEETENNLVSNWEGRSSELFVNKLVDLKLLLRGISEEIMDFASKINRFADRYEELDNSLNF